MFRELLQNSDDAFSNTVEIRFETERYININDSSQGQDLPPIGERLPDLKTALVRDPCFLPCFVGLIGCQGAQMDVKEQRHPIPG